MSTQIDPRMDATQCVIDAEAELVLSYAETNLRRRLAAIEGAALLYNYAASLFPTTSSAAIAYRNMFESLARVADTVSRTRAPLPPAEEETADTRATTAVKALERARGETDLTKKFTALYLAAYSFECAADLSPAGSDIELHYRNQVRATELLVERIAERSRRT